jgi:hypothetical protein
MYCAGEKEEKYVVVVLREGRFTVEKLRGFEVGAFKSGGLR